MYHKVDCEEQHSIIRWKWYISDWAWADPEDTNKLGEEMAQMPMASTPAKLPFLFQPALRVSWGILYDQLTKEKKTQCWFTGGSDLICRHHLIVDKHSTYSSFLGHPKGISFQ